MHIPVTLNENDDEDDARWNQNKHPNYHPNSNRSVKVHSSHHIITLMQTLLCYSSASAEHLVELGCLHRHLAKEESSSYNALTYLRVTLWSKCSLHAIYLSHPHNSVLSYMVLQSVTEIDPRKSSRDLLDIQFMSWGKSANLMDIKMNRYGMWRNEVPKIFKARTVHIATDCMNAVHHLRLWYLMLVYSEVSQFPIPAQG